MEILAPAYDFDTHVLRAPSVFRMKAVSSPTLAFSH